jgi:two-component system response regulator HydG
MDEVERRHVLRVLDALQWNKAEAARVLGINRATLYRKLQRYGLEGSDN